MTSRQADPMTRVNDAISALRDTVREAIVDTAGEAAVFGAEAATLRGPPRPRPTHIRRSDSRSHTICGLPLSGHPDAQVAAYDSEGSCLDCIKINAVEALDQLRRHHGIADEGYFTRIQTALDRLHGVL